MLQAQEDIIKFAYENQDKSASHHMATHFPLNTKFPINSYVLARYENLGVLCRCYTHSFCSL